MHKLGFTSIELVFTVGYAFTLFFTAVNGLPAAQATYRDNARRQAVITLAAALDSYYGLHHSYPEKLTIADQGAVIKLGDEVNVPLANPVAALDHDLASTNQATVYCYKQVDSGYVLGADLEGAGQFEHTTVTDLHCDWQVDLVR